MAFILSGVVRVAVCVGLILWVRTALRLPSAALLLWAGMFYAPMLLAEGVYLARVLRDHPGSVDQDDRRASPQEGGPAC